MPYGYDPFEGLTLPQVGGQRASQQYGAPKRQPQTPAYAPAKYPPDPDIYRWDPLGWQPNNQTNPKLTPQPTIFRWDPNAQPPRPAQPGNGAAYQRPNVDRFGRPPQY